jgi:carbon monoxide dehydrogenase subunit G
MDLSGEYRIPASREAVWRALNDPEVLRRCIPGCEELNKISDTEFSAKVTSKIGPVRAKFTGKVTLSDLDPPKSYTISGEGQGGAAGFAKGGAEIALAEDGGETVLTYTAVAQVGGKLAQIGSRLIAGVSRKLADEFFGNLVEAVAPGAGAAAEAEAPAEAVAAAAPEAGGGLSPMVWVGGVVIAVIVLLLVFV